MWCCVPKVLRLVACFGWSFHGGQVVLEGLQGLYRVFAFFIELLELVFHFIRLSEFHLRLPFLVDCPSLWLVCLALLGGTS